jgi:type IV pilus assembly protein PilY1
MLVLEGSGGRKMKNWIAKALITAAVFILPLKSVAEDIDLFLGSNASKGTPNVLFLIDNTGNWTAPFNAEKAALVSVFNAIKNLDQDINVGIMMFTETGGGNNNVDGGYIRAAIRSMQSTTGGDIHADLYSAMIADFHERDDKSNSGKAGLAMAEAYHYFAGLAPEAGNNKVKTDYLNNPSGIRAAGTITVTDGAICGFKGNGQPKSCSVSVPAGVTANGAVWALPGNALNGKAGTPYNSPVPAFSCGGNYIIYISNGAVQDSNSDNVRAEAMLTALGGDTTQIPLSPSGSVDVVADEWSRFMKESALGITTFTLDVNKRTTGQGPGWTRLLQSIAIQGGSEENYYDVSTAGGADELVQALKSALTKILAVNSVFVSAALPVASNSQSLFLNQVFIGQFRPDGEAKPRWPGNLKQYKLGLIGPELHLVDADEDKVIEGNTGFIQECARSFWTPTTADSYWAAPLTPAGNCPEAGFDPESNTPDGPIVEKGAQAYTLRASDPANRVVHTCSSTFASCTTLTPFADSNGTLTADGAAFNPSAPLTVVQTERLVNWTRGQDLLDEDGDTNLTEMRASAHGDVLHSRPVAVNYSGTGDPNEVVVYYGGNDGMLHAVNGNRSNAQAVGVDSTDAGNEFWTFMPPEFYSHLPRLAANTETIKFPASGVSAGTTGSPKPYGMDGPLSAVMHGSNHYLYAPMRRGGRALYAFDITDRWNPVIKWKVGCPNLTNDTGCLTSPDNWSNLGQTWSRPTTGNAAGYPSAPVVFMGGGYDGCEDYDNGSSENHACASSTKGNSIYVLDGDTGEILIEFPTDRAVPGDIIPLRVSDNDDSLTYAYATDTGGNVYRISGQNAGAPVPFGNLDPSVSGNWIITKIADLGCSGTANCALNRKFLFGPDAAHIPNSDEVVVLVGSGDREKPLEEYGAAKSVNNYYYVLYDKPGLATWLDYDATDPDDFDCGSSVICMGSLGTVDITGTLDPKKRGWKLPLATGEQVVTSSLLLADVTTFSTHIPEPPSIDPNNPSCEGLGTAATYNLNYKDAEGDKNLLTGGGLPWSPIGGSVKLDDGTIVPFKTTGEDGSPLSFSKPTTSSSHEQGLGKVYWNIRQ